MRHAKPMLPLLARLHRLALLVALAVSLTATGFAHRAPSAQDQALVTALAMGAGVADFCGDMPKGHAKAGTDCLACQITGSADLPPFAAAPLPAGLVLLAALAPPAEAPAGPGPRDPGHSPQGPPAA